MLTIPKFILSWNSFFYLKLLKKNKTTFYVSLHILQRIVSVKIVIWIRFSSVGVRESLLHDKIPISCNRTTYWKIKKISLKSLLYFCLQFLILLKFIHFWADKNFLKVAVLKTNRQIFKKLEIHIHRSILKTYSRVFYSATKTFYYRAVGIFEKCCFSNTN